MCAIEDETAVVVVASYHSVPRNPVRFKALNKTYLKPAKVFSNTNFDVGNIT